MKKIFIALLIIPLLNACWVSQNKCKKLYQTNESKVYDAVIVPGIPYDGKSWDRVMWMRVNWAVLMYKKGLTKNIIFSGSATYTKYIEAKVMAEFAVKLGVPKEHILTECKAEHSTENVYYSAELAHQNNLKKLAIATDPFQTKMLKSFNKRYVKADYLPAIFDTLNKIPFDSLSVELNDSLIQNNFKSIKEREGFFKRFKGTLGNNIKHKKKLYKDN